MANEFNARHGSTGVPRAVDETVKANISVDDSSTVLVAAQAVGVMRTYLGIFNPHVTVVLFVKVGATAVDDEGIEIAPGGHYEFTLEKGNVPTEAVNAVGDAAGPAPVYVVEISERRG